MLRPLAESGSLPGAPLTPAMTTWDIGVLRCHFPIAGQTTARPRLIGAGIRPLQRYHSDGPHQFGSRLAVEADRLSGCLLDAVSTACPSGDR
jgi:hypothetical protein